MGPWSGQADLNKEVSCPVLSPLLLQSDSGESIICGWGYAATAPCRALADVLALPTGACGSGL